MKPLNSKLHKDLTISIANRFCVKDPEVGEIEKILRNYIKDYSKKSNFFYIGCEWKLNFSTSYTGYIKAKSE